MTCFINHQLVPCPSFLNFNVIGVLGIFIIVFVLLAIAGVLIASHIKIFQKAGRKWWQAIIPIYNVFIFLQIVNVTPWVLILLFIPYVNILVTLYISYALAKSFGKGIGFSFGLTFLSVIFIPILAFGKSTYSPHSGIDIIAIPNEAKKPE